ncbi:MAG: hypothetical protein PVJ39_15415 [Gammaproteobacteria bacterium]
MMKKATVKNHGIEPSNPFIQAFRGSFAGIRQWQELDEFWALLKQKADDSWYVYIVTEPAPDQPMAGQQLTRFIDEINQLLRREHEEDYCGIVYVDDKHNPQFIKIYDPNNLGVVCGFSDNPPLPGWIISRLPPVDLNEQTLAALSSSPHKANWWRRIFRSG